MRFYNLKTRSHVDVPESAVRKMKSIRQTKNGEQTRHMYKFVSADAYGKTDVPEQNAK
jgi:hypothetical protein